MRLLFFFVLSLFACVNNGTSIETGFVVESEESSVTMNIDVGPHLSLWRPQNSVLLDCPWISQQPTEDANTLNCAPTVMVMADACINQTIPTYDPDVINVIEWMDENVATYHGSGEDNNGSYTTPAEMEQVGNEYFEIPSKKFDEIFTLQGLYEDLESGIPVLIGVSGQGDNETDVMKSGPGHAMLLVGMTPTNVTFNDPGPYDARFGEEHTYTIRSFLETWQNGGVQFFQE